MYLLRHPLGTILELKDVFRHQRQIHKQFQRLLRQLKNNLIKSKTHESLERPRSIYNESLLVISICFILL
jgi:hypothetical protein